MSEIHHECGIAAVYHLPGVALSKLCPDGPDYASRLLPRMLLDIQNRGQLAAGITTYNPKRRQLIDTHKDIGSVTEVFRLAHREKCEALMKEYAGQAGIGHVRYATCGMEDRSYAQPFESHHLMKRKWFSFGFNGQLANYTALRDELLSQGDHHLARETDTEIIQHEISREFSGDRDPTLLEMIRNISQRFDGAYSIVYIDARGDMLVARDPLGIKPLCYAFDGSLFAAASESVALLNLGFEPEQIKSLPPAHAITIVDGELDIRQFTESPRRAHCFFEWIYFANVASTLDDRSVYLSRTALGVELAKLEAADGRVDYNDGNTIVVPVPDTSKAAADSMAYELGIPSREGLIRNRYSGRTFIEGGSGRRKKAETKYTPLREVLEGKKIFLVEDSIVRSTTMQVLLKRIKQLGGAKEVHVRVACPPIVAPCFYGIDMPTVDDLFAARFLDGPLTDKVHAEMAEKLDCDSLRYLPVEAIARAIDKPSIELCQACITGHYPTDRGQQLYHIDLQEAGQPDKIRRAYERAGAVTAS
jgi:amidophosphoribosyltransferase